MGEGFRKVVNTVEPVSTCARLTDTVLQTETTVMDNSLMDSKALDALK